jgi:hypothetical protein
VSVGCLRIGLPCLTCRKSGCAGPSLAWPHRSNPWRMRSFRRARCHEPGADRPGVHALGAGGRGVRWLPPAALGWRAGPAVHLRPRRRFERRPEGGSPCGVAGSPQSRRRRARRACVGDCRPSLDQVARTPASSLQDGCRIGRAGLPSTLLGCLFHAAEHPIRHVGQFVTTVKLARRSWVRLTTTVCTAFGSISTAAVFIATNVGSRMATSG